jgi:hypothetical protein
MVGRPTFGLAPNVLTRRVSLTALDPSGAIVGLASEGALLPNDETVSLLRSAHPVGYSWTVRKWAKRNTEGWAAKVAAAGSDLVSNLLPTDGADDVVFEWVKLRVSPNSNGSEALLKKHMAAEHIGLRRKRRPSNPASLRPSPAGSNTSLGLTRRKTENLLALDGVQQGPPPAKSKLFRRSSISSRPPTAPVINVPVPEVALPSMSEESRSPVSTRESEESAPGGTESVVDDESYDSDPEDSETPWQCSVWVKKTGKRQLIATLTPAPHHPKVIGILRIPMHVRTISLTPKVTNNGVSLPNFANFANNIANLGNNNNNSNGNGNNQNQNDTEIELTEENIKDVISVTAMWLVAREDFGGHSHKGKVKK